MGTGLWLRIDKSTVFIDLFSSTVSEECIIWKMCLTNISEVHGSNRTEVVSHDVKGLIIKIHLGRAPKVPQ